MTLNPGPNGQLVAAATALVDAIFGVLLALGLIHFKPDSAVVTLIVVAGFNFAGYILAYIQSTQHTTKAGMAHDEKMATVYHKNALELAAATPLKPLP